MLMDYMNIPVAFCVYMLKTQKVKQFRLFIYLKTICSGHFKLSDSLIKKTCSELGYKSEKTFFVHLKYLVQKKWITVNSKSGNYRLIGYKQVANRLKVPTSKGGIFYPEYSKCFTGYIAAVVITFYIKYRSHNERRSALKKWSARKSRLSASFILPHTYLAKVLKVSKTTAQRYRQCAIDTGLIIATKSYFKTYIPITEIHNYKKYSGVDPNTVRKIKKTIYVQQADKLKSLITLRKKRNIRFVSKKFGKKWYR